MKKKIIYIVLTLILGSLFYSGVFFVNQVKSYENILLQKIAFLEKEWNQKTLALEHSVELLENQYQKIDKKISALALGSKTSGDLEQAQELLRLILATHHDLDIVIQSFLTQQVFQGHDSQLEWIINLERLTPQDKLMFQRMMEKRVTWKDLQEKIQHSSIQPQPDMFWGVAKKLGIRIENTTTPYFQSLGTLEHFIAHGLYDEACTQRGLLESAEDIEHMLNELCSANQFIHQYWQDIEH
jgi:hypothetical protein